MQPFSPEVRPSGAVCRECVPAVVLNGDDSEWKENISGVNETRETSLDRRDKLKHIIDFLLRHDRLATNSAGVMVFLSRVIDDGTSASSWIRAFDLSPVDMNRIYPIRSIAYRAAFYLFFP